MKSYSEKTINWIRKSDKNREKMVFLVSEITQYAKDLIKNQKDKEHTVSLCCIKYFVLNKLNKKYKIKFSFTGDGGDETTEIVLLAAEAAGLKVMAD